MPSILLIGTGHRCRSTVLLLGAQARSLWRAQRVLGGFAHWHKQRLTRHVQALQIAVGFGGNPSLLGTYVSSERSPVRGSPRVPRRPTLL